jgi:carbonic anhydrase
MKKMYYKTAWVILATVIMVSCQPPTTNENENATNSTEVRFVRDKVLTQFEQEKLTPDLVIQSLKDGNQRFIKNELTATNNTAMVRDAAAGQYPEAIVLSCIDSRVPVEHIFDKGIGDLFVGRVAGNIVNDDMLASMEYACKVAGSKLILVMGHESCGAVKSAIDQVELGNITELLDKIKPAIELSADFIGDHSSKNDAYVDYVATNNVLETMKEIRENSSILKQMEESGQIKIVGAYYHLDTGEVLFLD